LLSLAATLGAEHGAARSSSRVQAQASSPSPVQPQERYPQQSGISVHVISWILQKLIFHITADCHDNMITTTKAFSFQYADFNAMLIKEVTVLRQQRSSLNTFESVDMNLRKKRRL